MKYELLALKQNLLDSYKSITAARDSLDIDIKNGNIDPATAETLRFHFLTIQDEVEELILFITLKVKALNEKENKTTNS